MVYSATVETPCLATSHKCPLKEAKKNNIQSYVSNATLITTQFLRKPWCAHATNKEQITPSSPHFHFLFSHKLSFMEHVMIIF